MVNANSWRATSLEPRLVVRVVRVVRVNIQKLVLGSPSLVRKRALQKKPEKKFLIFTLTTLTPLTFRYVLRPHSPAIVWWTTFRRWLK